MSATFAAPSSEWLISLSSLIGCVDAGAVLESIISASHVWIVGLCIGMIFPRHKQLANLRGFLFSSLTVVIGLGAHSQVLSRLAMLINGAIFIQSLWYRWTDPGTFHRLWGALVRFLTGDHINKEDVFMLQAERPQAARADGDERKWYIDESDLEFFIARVEGRAPVRADAWEPILQKQIPGELVYHAYRRMLKDIKKTEYLSTSVTCNTSPMEVMDFYLADPVRQQWDGLLTTAETVHDGDFQHRQQLVHWIRSFPFAFLSDRDYIIARQMFTRGDTVYGISKVVKYEAHNPGNTVQMDQYWSMWSCKPVQCPFGSGMIATETTLLHMEDFKIPEHLGRFAVKAGMWGFVRKMTPYLKAFVQERRGRGVRPNDADPAAFGAPAVDGFGAATHAVAGRRGKKKGFGRVVIAMAAAAVLVVVLNRRRGSANKQRRRARKLR